MFFFFGIMPTQKDLNYCLNSICARCGKVCAYKVVMQSSCFSIFFIPLFSFGKKYIVKSSCCNNVYLLNKEVGKQLEHGKNIVITDADLTLIGGNFNPYLQCPNCGYEVKEDFLHCPKCGTKL